MILFQCVNIFSKNKNQTAVINILRLHMFFDKDLTFCMLVKESKLTDTSLINKEFQRATKPVLEQDKVHL